MSYLPRLEDTFAATHEDAHGHSTWVVVILPETDDPAPERVTLTQQDGSATVYRVDEELTEKVRMRIRVGQLTP